jgi:hypothetical protein
MMPTLAQDSADPSWLQLAERLGLPIFLILFGCMIVWKLLPHVIDWFKESTASAKVVKEAVPDMKDALTKMANEGQQKLTSIDARTVLLEQKANEILLRLPPK